MAGVVASWVRTATCCMITRAPAPELCFGRITHILPISDTLPAWVPSYVSSSSRATLPLGRVFTRGHLPFFHPDQPESSRHHHPPQTPLPTRCALLSSHAISTISAPPPPTPQPTPSSNLPP